MLNPAIQDPTDQQLDTSLRPSKLTEFIGQPRIKQHLGIFIEAAQTRKEPIDHVLIYGPPGLGKTTLAHILAQELSVNIRVTSGPAIERAGDLASILTNLGEGDILFIDEIHRLNKVVEETLYPAMEDFCLDVIIGKGPADRTLRLDLPKFTIIGATTRAGLLSSPLRDRFGAIHKLEFYDPQDLSAIITRASKILNFDIEPDAALSLGHRSRGTPRIANRLLKRVRDLAQVQGHPHISVNIVDEALKVFEVDELGLDAADRKFLTVMAEHYDGGPVGLETLAASLAEDKSTLEEVIEPYLLQIGFIKRTPRGRTLTEHAYKHIGLTNPHTDVKQTSLV